MMTNLLTDDLASTRDLFRELLKFEIEYESDWFVSMTDADGNRVAAMSRTSEFVPEGFREPVRGVILTVIVDDVEEYFDRAKRMDVTVVEQPTDLPYGQRRLLLRDASGALVDISSPTPTAPLDPAYR